jgi:cyclo(L-tyrosyl-L-tyrosyl) synthase
MMDITSKTNVFQNGNEEYKKFSAILVSPNCQRIANNKEHVLLGISPFNSYYSEERISQLIKWGSLQFKNFHLFIPDTLPYHNFLAIGYSPLEAERKTKKQWKYLRNKIIRAFNKNGFTEDDTYSKMITIEASEKNLNYVNLYQACVSKYENDPVFKEKCLSASTFILEKYTNNAGPKMLHESVKYLLGEIPFYLNTPKILNINSSLFVYHEKVDFFTELYSDRTNNLLSDQQGHLILNF